MGLEISLTDEFRALTDQMISTIREKRIDLENLNFCIIKVPLTNPSVIETAKDFKDREAYKSGLARVLATPRLLDPERDAKVDVGDYILFSHEAKYSIYPAVTRLIFGLDILDEKDPILFIRDVDIMANLHSL